MSKIIPEGAEAPASSKKGAELSVSKATETSLVAKAKELLTIPMEFGDLVDALEFYCVYGRAPVMKGDKPQIEGNNIPVEEGYESKHYTSEQLANIVKQVKADLKPAQAPEEVTL